jgi:signal transduction histidine kinase
MKKFLGPLIVFSGITGLALPAFCQPVVNNISIVNPQSKAGEVSQLQQKIRTLQAEQASLKAGPSGTSEQSDMTKLQDQINVLQKRVSHLQTAKAQRAEKNTHMLKEMGVNG